MIDFAIQLARDAGRTLAERFGRNLHIAYKGEVDLVTEADLASEALIIERIQTHFPRHAIFAEESGITQARERRSSGEAKFDSEYRWIVDPLDGTTNYAHAYPCFCVSIALERKGETIIGVVYDPIRDELFAAEHGAGATLNGRRIRVSTTRELRRALVCTGFPYNPQGVAQFARQFVNFLHHAQSVRRDGSAALDLCYVAMGRFDGFWEDGLNAWDVAAGVLMIEEAGGRVTDFNGAPLDIYHPKVLVSNGLIHEAMRQTLAL